MIISVLANLLNYFIILFVVPIVIVDSVYIFVLTMTQQMNTATTQLQSLFVELVKIELANYSKLSLNMVKNTIQHFAEMQPFNTISIEFWHTLCSANGVKFSI